MDKIKRIALISFTMACIIWAALGVALGVTGVILNNEENTKVYANSKPLSNSEISSKGMDVFSWTDEETGVEYLVFRTSNGLAVIDREELSENN